MKTKIYILFLLILILLCLSSCLLNKKSSNSKLYINSEVDSDKSNRLILNFNREIHYELYTGEEIPRQGEYGNLTKWDKPPYDIACDYPYWRALPTVDKIPEIIKYVKNKHKDSSDEIPNSHLECLTRVSFDKLSYNNPTFDTAKAWRDWWKAVGEDYFRRVEMEGVSNPKAWKLLVGDAKIPCPTYKILIPNEWSFEINFRTGDYGGVQQEFIRMVRTKTSATLKRHYSVDSVSHFQYEVWNGFTPEEADQFLYALAYAIDQPWFFKKFILKPHFDSYVKSNPFLGAHPGRNWNNYYSGAKWSGVLLPNGNVWWSDNPWNWTSQGNYVFEDNSIDVGCKVVYPFFCNHYPEKKSVNGSPGWKPDPNPPPLKDQPKSLWPKSALGDQEK